MFAIVPAGERSGERTLAVLLVIGCGLSGWTPVADGDLYWHLAAGREMARTGSVLTSDPFSVSAAGRAWVDVHWLFQLMVYAVHALGGLRALVLCKCALIALGSLALFFAVEREARRVFVPLLIAALFFARHLLLLRPVIVSLVFLALFILVLERFRRGGAARTLLALPLLQVVWSNCQGLFALGPAVIAAFAIEALAELIDRRRNPAGEQSNSSAAAKHRWMASCAALFGSILASLLTPYGVRLVALPFQLLGRLVPQAGNPFDEVAENVPPFVLGRFAPAQLWHFQWFLGLTVLALLLSARRARIAHLLLLAGFAGLALIANRNVLLFYWIATPILAQQLAPQLNRVARVITQPIATRAANALYYSCVLLPILCAGTAAARETSLARPAPFRFPIESAKAIEKLPGSGTIFSADQDGGYLIWTLFPRFRPYIDTRLVLRTPEEYREYLGLAEDPRRFDAFAQRQRFSYVTLPVSYPDRYLHLIAHLYQSPEWELILSDGSETLFARRDAAGVARLDLGDGATVERIVAQLAQRYANAPRLRVAARLQLASLSIAVGELAQAERILGATPGRDALALRARALLAAGQLERAEQIAEQLFRDDAEDVRGLDLLAMVYVSRGEVASAARLLKRALAIDPFDSEAVSLLATMEEHRDGP